MTMNAENQNRNSTPTFIPFRAGITFPEHIRTIDSLGILMESAIIRAFGRPHPDLLQNGRPSFELYNFFFEAFSNTEVFDVPVWLSRLTASTLSEYISFLIHEGGVVTIFHLSDGFRPTLRGLINHVHVDKKNMWREIKQLHRLSELVPDVVRCDFLRLSGKRLRGHIVDCAQNASVSRREIIAHAEYAFGWFTIGLTYKAVDEISLIEHFTDTILYELTGGLYKRLSELTQYSKEVKFSISHPIANVSRTIHFAGGDIDYPPSKKQYDNLIANLEIGPGCAVSHIAQIVAQGAQIEARAFEAECDDGGSSPVRPLFGGDISINKDIKEQKKTEKESGERVVGSPIKQSEKHLLAVPTSPIRGRNRHDGVQRNNAGSRSRSRQIIIGYSDELDEASSPTGRIRSGIRTPPHIGVCADDVVRVSRVDAHRSPDKAKKALANGISECNRMVEALTKKLVALAAEIAGEDEEIYYAEVLGLSNPLNNINIGFSDDMQDAFDDVNDTIKGLIDRIPTVSQLKELFASGCDGVSSVIASFFSEFKAELPIILTAVVLTLYALGATLVMLVNVRGAGKRKKGRSMMGRVLTIVKIVLPIWLALRMSTALKTGGFTPIIHSAELFLRRVSDWCETCRREPEVFEAESAPDLEGVPEFMSKFTVSIMSWFILRQVPDGKKLEKFVTFAAIMPRATEGLKKGFELIVELFQKAVNFIRLNMLGLDKFTWFENTQPAVDKWCRKVDALADQSHRGMIQVNQYNAVRVRTLLLEGNHLMLGKYDVAESTRVRSAVSVYMRTLTKMYAPFERANFAGVKPRMEPVTIFLYGESGVGKSTLTYPLMVACLARTLPPERLAELRLNYMDMIYNRQPEHKFWDGYRGQRATVFDDFGQVRDVEGVADGEIMDIIRCTNMMPNVLHMAHLEDKGTSVWEGDYILCTSNKSNFDDARSITQPEALHRRFNLSFMVVPAKRFCTSGTKDSALRDRRLDPDRVASLGKGFQSSIYEFHTMDMRSTGQMLTGTVLTYSEVVEMATNRFHKNWARSEAVLSDVQDIVAREVSVREAAQRVAPDEFEAEATDEIGHGIDPRPMFGHVGGSGDAVPEATMEEIESAREFDEEEGPVAGPSTYRRRGARNVTQDPEVPSRTQFIQMLMHSRVEFTYFSRVASAVKALSPNLSHLSMMDTLRGLYLGAPDLWADINPLGGQNNCTEMVTELNAIAGTDDGDDIARAVLFVLSPNRLEEADMTSLSKARNALNSWFEFVQRKMKQANARYPMLSYAMKLMAGLTVGYGLYSVYQYFFPNGMNEAESGENRHKGSRNRDNKARRQEQRRSKAYYDFYGESGGGPPIPAEDEDEEDALMEEWLAQGGGDSNSIEMARKVIQKSLYEMRLPGLEERIGLCLVLKGHVAVLPYHYVVMFKNKIEDGVLSEEDEITFSNDFMKSGPYKIRVREVLSGKEDELLKGSDLATFVLPKSVHQHPDITRYFVTSDVMSKNMTLTVHSCILERDHVWRLATGIATKVGSVKVQYNHYKYVLPEAYRYHFATAKGDCGNLLILNNRSVGPGKIIGMHVAGSGVAGISTPMTYELVQRIVNMYTMEDSICPPDQVVMEPQCMESPVPGNFIPLYTIPRVATKVPDSKIAKSPLCGLWMEPLTAPARLNPFIDNGVWVDPRVNGVAGYGTAHFRIKDEILTRCVELYSSRINNVSSEIGYRAPKIFSFEEAVLGVPGEEHVESINRKTSPGYPHILEQHRGYSGKEYWFGKGEDFDLSSPQCAQLKERVLKLVLDAARGVRGFNPYVDFPKDERRKLEKVRTGKTRSISSCPLEYSLAFRMFFLDFSVFYMKAGFSVGSAVGVNVYSTQWDELARLLRVFFGVIAGDYVGFDKNQLVEFLWGGYHVIQAWYNDGPRNALIRKVLWADVVSSIHLFKGTFMQWLKSLPSGNPFTTIINTIVNLLIILYVYALLGAKHGYGLNTFYDNVLVVAYGDDNVIGITQQVSSWFNCVTIGEIVRTFGMDYTDDTKEGVPLPWRSLEEVTFLKRYFRFEEVVHKFVAPLVLEVVLEIPMWTTRGPLEEDITRTNVVVALNELSLHGESVYDKWAPLILEASTEVIGFTPPSVTFKTNLYEALTTDDIW